MSVYLRIFFAAAFFAGVTQPAIARPEIDPDTLRKLEFIANDDCYHENLFEEEYKKRCQDGIVLIERKLESDPHNVQLLILLIKMLTNLDRPRSVEVAKKVVSLDRKNIYALYYLGMFGKDLKKSVEYYKRVVKLDPNHRWANKSLAGLYIHFGDGAKATKAMKQHIKRDQDQFVLAGFAEKMTDKGFASELPDVFADYLVITKRCDFIKSLQSKFKVQSNKKLAKLFKELCEDKKE